MIDSKLCNNISRVWRFKEEVLKWLRSCIFSFLSTENETWQFKKFCFWLVGTKHKFLTKLFGHTLNIFPHSFTLYFLIKCLSSPLPLEILFRKSLILLCSSKNASSFEFMNINPFPVAVKHQLAWKTSWQKSMSLAFAWESKYLRLIRKKTWTEYEMKCTTLEMMHLYTFFFLVNCSSKQIFAYICIYITFLLRLKMLWFAFFVS